MNYIKIDENRIISLDGIQTVTKYENKVLHVNNENEINVVIKFVYTNGNSEYLTILDTKPDYPKSNACFAKIMKLLDAKEVQR